MRRHGALNIDSTKLGEMIAERVNPKPYVPGVISEGDGWPDHVPASDKPMQSRR